MKLIQAFKHVLNEVDSTYLSEQYFINCENNKFEISKYQSQILPPIIVSKNRGRLILRQICWVKIYDAYYLPTTIDNRKLVIDNNFIISYYTTKV